MNAPFLPETGIIENIAESITSLDVMRDLVLDAVERIRAGDLRGAERSLGGVLDQMDEAHKLLALEKPATSRQMPEPA
ncbi:hypothetical protein FW320_05505 [Azospirillum sp. Vi22]|uniref:hypothetical protein n=1 Tax=Azospirillum baldaniorum TaxID=1064539 RepID=UPI00157A2DFD|nr:hypothetical protein [Azospirillum baldaniorum]NUB05634.1 hypothetical protein [Azospirillum baldaniorum]